MWGYLEEGNQWKWNLGRSWKELQKTDGRDWCELVEGLYPTGRGVGGNEKTKRGRRMYIVGLFLSPLLI